MKAIETDNYAILTATQRVEELINKRMEVSNLIRNLLSGMGSQDKLIMLAKLHTRYNGNHELIRQILTIAHEVLNIDTSGVMDVVKSEELTPIELNSLLYHEKITPFQAIAYIAQYADDIETAREFLNMNVKLYEPMHLAIKLFALGEHPHGVN